MRLRLAVLAASAALVIAACGSTPCEQLGQRICQCDPAGAQDACTSAVQNIVTSGAQAASQSDQNYCEGLLKTCGQPLGSHFCDWLKSPQGKQQCGLACWDDGIPHTADPPSGANLCTAPRP